MLGTIKGRNQRWRGLFKLYSISVLGGELACLGGSIYGVDFRRSPDLVYM